MLSSVTLLLLLPLKRSKLQREATEYALNAETVCGHTMRDWVLDKAYTDYAGIYHEYSFRGHCGRCEKEGKIRLIKVRKK